MLIIPRRGLDTTSGRWIQSIGAALRPVFVFEDPMIYACRSGRESHIRSGRSGSGVSSESVCPHVGLKEAATSLWFGHSDPRSADAVLGSEVYLSAAVHASISETRWRHAGAGDQPSSVAKYLNVGCYHQPFRGRPGRGVQRSGSLLPAGGRSTVARETGPSELTSRIRARRASAIGFGAAVSAGPVRAVIVVGFLWIERRASADLPSDPRATNRLPGLSPRAIFIRMS